MMARPQPGFASWMERGPVYAGPKKPERPGKALRPDGDATAPLAHIIAKGPQSNIA
jgi:hypothetical protein